MRLVVGCVLAASAMLLLLLPTRAQTSEIAAISDELMNGGVGASEVEMVKAVGFALAVRDLCGNDYMNDDQLVFMQDFYLTQSGIPKTTFTEFSARYQTAFEASMTASPEATTAACNLSKQPN